MTDSDAELLARLKGFTPGPHSVSGTRHSGDLKIGANTQLHMIGPDGDAAAAVFYDMRTGRGFNDARLYAAAPDLHRIATEQAAEIARLRRCLSGLLGFHDGEPITWVESERRIDAARAALAAKS